MRGFLGLLPLLSFAVLQYYSSTIMISDQWWQSRNSLGRQLLDRVEACHASQAYSSRRSLALLKSMDNTQVAQTCLMPKIQIAFDEIAAARDLERSTRGIINFPLPESGLTDGLFSTAGYSSVPKPPVLSAVNPRSDLAAFGSENATGEDDLNWAAGVQKRSHLSTSLIPMANDAAAASADVKRGFSITSDSDSGVIPASTVNLTDSSAGTRSGLQKETNLLGAIPRLSPSRAVEDRRIQLLSRDTDDNVEEKAAEADGGTGSSPATGTHDDDSEKKLKGHKVLPHTVTMCHHNGDFVDSVWEKRIIAKKHCTGLNWQHIRAEGSEAQPDQRRNLASKEEGNGHVDTAPSQNKPERGRKSRAVDAAISDEEEVVGAKDGVDDMDDTTDSHSTEPHANLQARLQVCESESLALASDAAPSPVSGSVHCLVPSWYQIVGSIQHVQATVWVALHLESERKDRIRVQLFSAAHDLLTRMARTPDSGSAVLKENRQRYLGGKRITNKVKSLLTDPLERLLLTKKKLTEIKELHSRQLVVLRKTLTSGEADARNRAMEILAQCGEAESSFDAAFAEHKARHLIFCQVAISLMIALAVYYGQRLVEDIRDPLETCLKKSATIVEDMLRSCRITTASFEALATQADVLLDEVVKTRDFANSFARLDQNGETYAVGQPIPPTDVNQPSLAPDTQAAAAIKAHLDRAHTYRKGMKKWRTSLQLKASHLQQIVSDVCGFLTPSDLMFASTAAPSIPGCSGAVSDYTLPHIISLDEVFCNFFRTLTRYGWQVSTRQELVSAPTLLNNQSHTIRSLRRSFGTTRSAVDYRKTILDFEVQVCELYLQWMSLWKFQDDELRELTSLVHRLQQGIAELQEITVGSIAAKMWGQMLPKFEDMMIDFLPLELRVQRNRSSGASADAKSRSKLLKEFMSQVASIGDGSGFGIDHIPMLTSRLAHETTPVVRDFIFSCKFHAVVTATPGHQVHSKSHISLGTQVDVLLPFGPEWLVRIQSTCEVLKIPNRILTPFEPRRCIPQHGIPNQVLPVPDGEAALYETAEFIRSLLHGPLGENDIDSWITKILQRIRSDTAAAFALVDGTGPKGSGSQLDSSGREADSSAQTSLTSPEDEESQELEQKPSVVNLEDTPVREVYRTRRQQQKDTAATAIPWAQPSIQIVERVKVPPTRLQASHSFNNKSHRLRETPASAADRDVRRYKKGSRSGSHPARPHRILEAVLEPSSSERSPTQFEANGRSVTSAYEAGSKSASDMARTISTDRSLMLGHSERRRATSSGRYRPEDVAPSGKHELKLEVKNQAASVETAVESVTTPVSTEPISALYEKEGRSELIQLPDFREPAANAVPKRLKDIAAGTRTVSAIGSDETSRAADETKVDFSTTSADKDSSSSFSVVGTESATVIRSGLNRSGSYQSVASEAGSRIISRRARTTSTSVPHSQTQMRQLVSSFGKHRPSNLDEEFSWRFHYSNRRCRMLQIYPCALVGKILLQGKLYISTTAVGFHSAFNDSTLFSSIPTLVFFELEEISAMRKKTYALFFQNAIEFDTKDGNRYLFTSFLRRDKAWGLLSSLTGGRLDASGGQDNSQLSARVQSIIESVDHLSPSVRTSTDSETGSGGSTISELEGLGVTSPVPGVGVNRAEVALHPPVSLVASVAQTIPFSTYEGVPDFPTQNLKYLTSSFQLKNVTLDEVIQAYCLDDAFMKNLLGDPAEINELKLGAWSTPACTLAEVAGAQGHKITRTSTWVKTIPSNPLAGLLKLPKSSLTTDLAELLVHPNLNAAVLQSVVMLHDFPWKFKFHVRIRFTAVQRGNAVQMDPEMEMEWLQKSWLAGKVEGGCVAEWTADVVHRRDKFFAWMQKRSAARSPGAIPSPSSPSRVTVSGESSGRNSRHSTTGQDTAGAEREAEQLLPELTTTIDTPQKLLRKISSPELKQLLGRVGSEWINRIALLIIIALLWNITRQLRENEKQLDLLTRRILENSRYETLYAPET